SEQLFLASFARLTEESVQQEAGGRGGAAAALADLGLGLRQARGHLRCFAEARQQRITDLGVERGAVLPGPPPPPGAAAFERRPETPDIVPYRIDAAAGQRRNGAYPDLPFGQGRTDQAQRA